MDMFQIIGIALTAALLAVLLRQYRKEYAVLLGLSAGLLLLMMIIQKALPVFSSLQALMSRAGVTAQYAVILLKALGICFLTQLAADTCTDAGETAIASKIELAGKFAVLLIAMPLFIQIADLAVSLLG